MTVPALEFVFTEQIISTLLQLNERLKKEELRIKPFWEKLVASLEQQVKDKVIDDYNLKSELAFFSDDKFYKRLYKECEGNPIWQDTTYLLFSNHKYEDHKELYIDDWNEFGEDHPMAKIPFCYTMHCLVFHSPMAWEDILRIDDVWIELKVEHQFLIATK